MQYPVFTDNLTVFGDGTEEHPLTTATIPGVVPPTDLIFGFEGVGSNTQIVVAPRLGFGIKFLALAAASWATASANATADTTYTLSQNGVPFATIKFPAGQKEGAFTQAADVTFVPGDKLQCDGPAVADVTLEDVWITFEGTRT